MRRLASLLLRTLLLAVVFMASALTAMRFAIHGRQTTVPKLLGLTASQAERTLADRGLALDTGDRFFSADVPVGRILSQTPAPGEQVRRGWHVRVAESMGPQRVVIPDLTGESERAAEINVRRRGLEMGSIANAELPGAPPDQIVAQSPPANAVNVSSPVVGVLVAGGEERKSFVMPDLTGRGINQAIDAIVAAGLKVGHIESQPPAPAPGTPAGTLPAGTRMVVRTSPSAGQRVWEGQAIALEVTW